MSYCLNCGNTGAMLSPDDDEAAFDGEISCPCGHALTRPLVVATPEALASVRRERRRIVDAARAPSPLGQAHARVEALETALRTIAEALDRYEHDDDCDPEERRDGPGECWACLHDLAMRAVAK